MKMTLKYRNTEEKVRRTVQNYLTKPEKMFIKKNNGLECTRTCRT